MPSILVVDDERSIRESLDLLLSGSGYHTETAADGLEALSFLTKRDFQLVISDIHMPNMNGLELLKVIRKQWAERIPIILITAYPTLESSSLVLDAGARDLLIKPFDSYKLVKAVETVLRPLKPAGKTTTPFPGETERHFTPAWSLQTLDEMSKNITGLLHSEEMIATFIHFLQEAFRADHVLMSISRPGQPDLALSHSKSNDSESAPEAPTARDLLREVVLQGQTGLIGEADSNQLFQQTFGLQDGALLSIPLKNKSGACGGILLYNRDNKRTFASEIKQFISILGRVVCLASLNDLTTTELGNYQGQAIQSLFAVIEACDEVVLGHSARVACYTLLLGNRLGLDEIELRNLEYLALLHDIGKIALPRETLRKKERSEAEERMLQSHVQISEQIIQPLSFIPEGGRIIRHHHEHFNGAGYPDGLRGEDIPLFSRVIAVADAFDNMLSACDEQNQNEKAQVMEIMIRSAGKQFDPALLTPFLEAFRGIMMKIK